MMIGDYQDQKFENRALQTKCQQYRVLEGLLVSSTNQRKNYLSTEDLTFKQTQQNALAIPLQYGESFSEIRTREAHQNPTT